LAATPIWLTFGQRWTLTLEARDALSSLAANTPPRLFAGDKSTLLPPSYAPTFETRYRVLDAVIEQLIGIADSLPVTAPAQQESVPAAI